MRLGDGLSQAALAGQLALQEAASASRQFAGEDLARLRDDLTAVRDLFAETVERGLSAGKAFTTDQVAAAGRHADRVGERLGPAVTQALDAVRQHPVAFARESLQAGVSAGQCAAGRSSRPSAACSSGPATRCGRRARRTAPRRAIVRRQRQRTRPRETPEGGRHERESGPVL